jgi:hypothetical protein
MARKRKEYAAPRIEKRELLKEIAATGSTVSGQLVTPKGGCFKQEERK